MVTCMHRGHTSRRGPTVGSLSVQAGSHCLCCSADSQTGMQCRVLQILACLCGVEGTCMHTTLQFMATQPIIRSTSISNSYHVGGDHLLPLLQLQPHPYAASRRGCMHAACIAFLAPTKCTCIWQTASSKQASAARL